MAITYVGFRRLVDRFDWPRAFVVTATITLALGFLWLVVAADSMAGRRPAARPQATLDGRATTAPRLLAWLRDHRNLILLTLSYAAVGYFQYLFFYWVHHYFETVLKLGEQESRWYAMIPRLCMACQHAAGGLGVGSHSLAIGRLARDGVGVVRWRRCWPAGCCCCVD